MKEAEITQRKPIFKFMASKSPLSPSLFETNKPFLAAGAAGMITFLAADLSMHAIDTVRARIQAESTRFFSFRGMAKQMFKEGARSFFRGASVTSFVAPTANFLYFFTYNKLRNVFQGSYGLASDSATFLASLVGTTLLTIYVSPFEIVRTRLQMGASYRGPISGMIHIAKKEGSAPFLATYGVKLIFIPLQTATTFAIYEKLRNVAHHYCKKDDGGIHHQRYISASAGSYFTASLITTLLFMPVSTLLTRLQLVKNELSANKPGERFTDILRSLLRNEGAKGLGKGWSARLILTLFYSTIPMPIYEAVKLRLGGSH